MRGKMVIGNLGFCNLFIVCSFLILCLSFTATAEQCLPATVTIDGEDVMPLGWYALNASDYTTALETLPLTEGASHGYDFVMMYYPFRCSDAAVLYYLDQARTAKNKVLIDIHDCDLIELQRRVTLVKDHAALYGYYLDDEPEIRGISAATIIERYNAVKAIDSDPDHPVVLTFYNDLSTVRDYLPGTDIIGKELYTQSKVRSHIRSDVVVARNAGKGLLACPGPFQTDSRTLPTASEMRYQILAPIAAGAGGLFNFIFQGHVGYAPGPPPEGYRDEIVYPYTDMVNAIAPLLLSGANGINVTSQYANSTYMVIWENDVAWVIAGDSEDAVIVAANFGDSATYRDVDFTIMGLDASIVSGEVVGEGRTVSLDATGKFEDSFDEYATHVYRFTKDDSVSRIFSDDFERADADTLGSEWVTTDTFGIRSGNAVNLFTTGTVINAFATVAGFTMETGTTYTMSSTMFIQRAGQYAGLVWCYDDADNTYLMNFKQEGAVHVFRYNSGVGTLLVNTTHGFAIPDRSEVPIAIDVEFSESGEFTIIMTNTQTSQVKTISYTDATPLTSGSCGLASGYPGAASRFQWQEFAIASDRVQTPVFSPEGGTLAVVPTPITITTLTPGANIYYTTDGTTPSDTNGTLYTTAINVNHGDTLKAIATLVGYTDSVIASQTYSYLQAGDANFDGLVDVGDLGILAANYGTTSGATWAQGDFNNDGAVDVGDLGILAANYGSGASSTVNFDADYAKVFGDIIADNDEVGGSLCSSLGLSLIAGLILIGLMLVKLEN